MLMMMMVKSLINYQWEHFQNFRDKNGLLPNITQVPYGTLVDSWHTFSFTSVTDGTLVCLAEPLIVWSVTEISRRLLISVTDQTIKGSARMWISSWYLTFWSRYILKSWYPLNVHFIAIPPAPGILGILGIRITHAPLASVLYPEILISLVYSHRYPGFLVSLVSGSHMYPWHVCYILKSRYPWSVLYPEILISLVYSHRYPGFLVSLVSGSHMYPWHVCYILKSRYPWSVLYPEILISLVYSHRYPGLTHVPLASGNPSHCRSTSLPQWMPGMKPQQMLLFSSSGSSHHSIMI